MAILITLKIFIITSICHIWCVLISNENTYTSKEHHYIFPNQSEIFHRVQKRSSFCNAQPKDLNRQIWGSDVWTAIGWRSASLPSVILHRPTFMCKKNYSRHTHLGSAFHKLARRRIISEEYIPHFFLSCFSRPYLRMSPTWFYLITPILYKLLITPVLNPSRLHPT